MPRCPNCGCPHCPAGRTVERDILTPKGRRAVVRRRRSCRHCGNVFYTREEVEDEELIQLGLKPREEAAQAPTDGPPPLVVPPQRSGRPSGGNRPLPPEDNPFLTLPK